MQTSEPIVRSYRRLLANIRGNVGARVLRAWDGLDSYTTDEIEEFLSVTVPLILAGQTESVRLTDSFLASYSSQNGVPAEIGTLEPEEFIGFKARNGTSVEETYRRPFLTAIYGGGILAGRARLAQTVNTDIALATRAATHYYMSKDERVKGYTRNTSSTACRYCRQHATSAHGKQEQMPLHPNCGCISLPVFSSLAVGAIAANLLHTPPDEDADIAIHEHGELGNVLYSDEWDYSEQPTT